MNFIPFIIIKFSFWNRRGREREREKPDFRREKRSDVREKIQRGPHEELPKEQAKVKIEQVKEEPKKGPIEETGQNVEVAVSPKMDAEQWVDPWMRRQPAQNRSPEIRSPVRKGDDLSSIGSSESGEGKSCFLCSTVYEGS